MKQTEYITGIQKMIPEGARLTFKDFNDGNQLCVGSLGSRENQVTLLIEIYYHDRVGASMNHRGAIIGTESIEYKHLPKVVNECIYKLLLEKANKVQ